ncbi:uncharacterized protein LOC128219487 [Mya arenaria]|uniref:uncharacterized protein LOC128219487 n=1 Tax=Mya arenaria TaxID=6604 RepID=UPI0022DF1604|nr:uncharacterized protein LOC128219487 [Mya arenaria]
MADNVPQPIQKKLADVFGNEPDNFARALFFLLYCENTRKKTNIRSLQALLGDDRLFKSQALRLVKETKEEDKDSELRQNMHEIWSNYMRDDREFVTNSDQKWNRVKPRTSIACTKQACFRNAVKRLSKPQFNVLQTHLQNLSASDRLQNAVAIAIGGSSVVIVGLVACTLAFGVIKNIKRWWKDEITGIRCVKNIMDFGLSVAAGVIGGIGGELVGLGIGGAIAGPVGGVIGAIAGAVVGFVYASKQAHELADRLTQWAFGLPKSEALENAYRFLGLPLSSSNGEINTKYRMLALQYHPDKGGDKNKWTQLQYSLALIREARGET